MVEWFNFRHFPRQKKALVVFHLCCFFGNRFNVLFYNAARTYYLEGQLMKCFERVSTEKKRVSAVHGDLHAPTYFAA